MLSERFFRRLEDAFPHFYDRVSADAMEDARRIMQDTGGDVEKALLRARFESAGRLWWPYVKGSVPVVGNDLAAMEAFTRLVLTVDFIVGHAPPDLSAARRQVVLVLRESLDVERLRNIVRRDAKDAAAGAGLVATMSALLGPLTMARRVSKWSRFVPVPVRVTLGAVVVAALLSLPLMAGYSAGRNAERVARSS
ncbi:MAG: hypothetical protein WDA16_06285 [Candidatus Thermoplasmatota archaeon]